MRFITAAILFVVSAVMILTGIADRTIWHPPATHVQVIDVNTKSPLVIVKNSTLTQYAGVPTVEVTSNSKPFLAIGRQHDIDAWVGGTPHVEVSGLAGTTTPRSITHEVAGNQVSANPAGSDLWYSEYNLLGRVSATVDPANDTALLIANNGFDAAASKITLTWGIVFNDGPSRNLLIGGGIILFIAVIMNFWAWYSMRRDRGPRRRTPRAPQGPRTRRRRSPNSAAPSRGRRSARGFVATTGGILVLASLTGCSQPAATSSPTATAATKSVVQEPAVVNQAQLVNIVGRISAVVALADAAKDPKLMSGRVIGPALDSRGAYYTLEKTSKKIPAIAPVASNKIRLALPAQNASWPRTVMVVTSSGKSTDLPQMLVLQQDSPRTQYQLWYNIDMLPGVKFPVVNDAQTGAVQVAAASQFLKLAPNALPVAFGDLIDNGPASLSASLFDVSKDEFYQQIHDSQMAQKANLKNATVAVTHSLGNPNVLALSTVNSGALVAVSLTDQYVIKPKDRTHAVAVAGNEKLMLGSAGSATGIRSTYGSMLLFYVPAVASKDKIITLGATQTLISVRGL